MSLGKKLCAEFIGTFVLVFFGCGTAVVAQCSTDNYPGYILTALAFGLVIVAMAYSIGNVSGCHINPAVSIAMLVSGKMTAKDFAGYVLAQVVGAIAGAGVLKAVLGANAGALGTNGLYNGSAGASFIIEIILTFVFVIAILGVTSKPEFGSVAGLVIGLSLTLVHILGIAFTGTSVNPARSLGPALFVGGDALACVWVFILAPLVGGALAAVVYKTLSAE
ncbi:MAG: aquaporin [Eubacterium sp.]|nr:aquaporin [Eubacterium sp.]